MWQLDDGGSDPAHAAAQNDDCLYLAYSEDQDLVRPLRPVSELFERASVSPLGQLGCSDTAGVHTGPAHAYLGAVPDNGTDHRFKVIVTLRNLLARLGAAGGIAQQEEPYLFAFALCQRAGEAQRIVAALGTVGRIIQDK